MNRETASSSKSKPSPGFSDRTMCPSFHFRGSSTSHSRFTIRASVKSSTNNPLGADATRGAWKSCQAWVHTGRPQPAARGGDPPPFGDAAAGENVGLRDGDGLVADPFAETPASGFDLATGHRDGALATQPRVVVDVVGAEGLLDPERIVLGHRAQETHRLGYVLPGIVGVHHQQNVGADGLAGGRDAAPVLRDAGAADLHLGRLEALGDVAAHLLGQALLVIGVVVVAAAGIGGHRPLMVGPEEPPQWQAGGLRVAVPERDVEGSEGPDDGPGTPLQQGILVHLLPQRLGGERILADQEGGKKVLHRRETDLAAAIAAIGRSDALVSVVTGDADEKVLPGGDPPRGKNRFGFQRAIDQRTSHRIDRDHVPLFRSFFRFPGRSGGRPPRGLASVSFRSRRNRACHRKFHTNILVY